jgi:aryl-alcohol dehydrogenase-like predicted oxidoreductase
MTIPRFELESGYSISRIIRGGWQLAEGHGRTRIDASAALDGMRRSLEAGITTFDCADIYTGVEELIGRFLCASGRRADVQIHTKYVPDLDDLATLKEKDVETAIDRSLRRLAVECLDLVQFHWWDFDVPGYVETALWLTRLQRSGKIRHLGVTNFDVEHLSELVEAGVPIAANQVQYSVLDRRPEHGLSGWCKEKGIHLLCYGTLAGGFLSGRYVGAEAPPEPFENRSLAKYRLIIEESGGWGRFQDLLKALSAVARRHGVTLSAIATRFVLDRPAVAAAIVGLRTPAHFEDAHRLFECTLDDEDVAKLEACLAAAPGPLGTVYGLEREKGGSHAKIMKTNLNRAGF